MAYKIGYKIKSKEEMGSCCGNEQAKEQGMLLVQGSGRRAVSGMELDEEEGKRRKIGEEGDRKKNHVNTEPQTPNHCLKTKWRDE